MWLCAYLVLLCAHAPTLSFRLILYWCLFKWVCVNTFNQNENWSKRIFSLMDSSMLFSVNQCIFRDVSVCVCKHRGSRAYIDSATYLSPVESKRQYSLFTLTVNLSMPNQWGTEVSLMFVKVILYGIFVIQEKGEEQGMRNRLHSSRLKRKMSCDIQLCSEFVKFLLLNMYFFFRVLKCLCKN